MILFTIAGIIARRRRLKRMQMHLAGQPQLIPVNPSGGGMFGFGRGGGNMFGGRVFGGPMHPQPHTQQHPHTEQAATYPSPPPMYPNGRNGQGGLKGAQVPPPPYNPEVCFSLPWSLWSGGDANIFCRSSSSNYRICRCRRQRHWIDRRMLIRTILRRPLAFKVLIVPMFNLGSLHWGLFE